MKIAQRVLEQTFNAAVTSVQPIKKGEENRNFLVEMGANQYVLRVYSLEHSTTGPRKKSEIDFELDFIDFVHRLNVPTPQVIPTQYGEKIVMIRQNGEARYSVLFEYIKGEEATAYDAQNARAIAELLLRMRRASLAYPHGTVRKWPGDIIKISLDFYQQHRQRAGKYQQALDGIYVRASEGYQKIQGEWLPRGIIHGDIKLGNLLFERSEVRAVLDFDDYRESYLLEELTRTLLHDLDSATRNAIRSGCYPVFQKAFEGDASLPASELADLKTFLSARLLYDQTNYIINGDHQLVDEIFEDRYITEVIQP